jgi:hypothetical protein
MKMRNNWDYLLELIEDDDLPSAATKRFNARASLLRIKELQKQRYTELQEIDDQRALRRAKRAQSTK